MFPYTELKSAFSELRLINSSSAIYINKVSTPRKSIIEATVLQTANYLPSLQFKQKERKNIEFIAREKFLLLTLLQPEVMQMGVNGL